MARRKDDITWLWATLFFLGVWAYVVLVYLMPPITKAYGIPPGYPLFLAVFVGVPLILSGLVLGVLIIVMRLIGKAVDWYFERDSGSGRDRSGREP